IAGRSQGGDALSRSLRSARLAAVIDIDGAGNQIPTRRNVPAAFAQRKHMSAKPILGLTMGDPAGIGPEICLRALREPAVLAECIPVLFGDADVLKRVASSSSSSS